MCHGAILGHVGECRLSFSRAFNTISSNCTAKNSGAYCRAVHCIQGSVFVPCVHARQIGENREGRVGSRGLWVEGGSATFSAHLRCIYIGRGQRVRQ